ncbi:helix-turn-helix transcriptional regulator [Actinacidiphila acididurans]|uniref:Helix-turn-helix domain-containing protein n=1 Tax=Actinacidiphila acididurans TaxID=2784346 RepID=A0ABS2U458_9ACTN|nr:helix-turn-helix transcriptional regulator [Actinacidiphila acididurans]MBM9508928.1 helix-turn-helix domain-containing protein [Actinacidiphila acididurans]
MAREELARFLRDRRAGLRPDHVALPAGPGRRTPGLRREEVAELAHMSTDYYVRLEQARGPRPSARILDGLAEALLLAPAERTHLFRLAGVVPEPPAGPPRRVRPHVTALLHRLPATAAVVTSADYEVLAWNPLADALLGGLAANPNLARRRFLLREPVLTCGHEDFAAFVVWRLRAAADRYPHDAELTSLLRELHDGSAEFRATWAANPVRAPGHRTKTMTHPDLGPLRINCDILTVPEDDQQVVLMTADPGTSTADAFLHLAAAGQSV